MVQVLRREAHELLNGQPLKSNSLEHLLLARAYAKLGEQEKSDAHFQAATAAAANDPQALLAQVRVLDQLGKHDLAEATFQKAAELNPTNAELWIARGRYHVEQGNRERTEAAFTKAASLTPEELNKFIEAGWWVSSDNSDAVDPLSQVQPTETASSFATIAASAPGQKKWWTVPTTPRGQVDFQSVAEVKALATAYAVNYVYSPEAKSVTLLVGGEGQVALQLNGELIYEGGNRTWHWGLARAGAAAARPQHVAGHGAEARSFQCLHAAHR